MHLSCKCASKFAPEGQLRLQLAPFLLMSQLFDPISSRGWSDFEAGWLKLVTKAPFIITLVQPLSFKGLSSLVNTLPKTKKGKYTAVTEAHKECT